MFSLLSLDDEAGAGADDLLTVLPYLVLKADIFRLPRHLMFLDLVQSEFCKPSHNYVKSTFELSVQII